MQYEICDCPERNQAAFGRCSPLREWGIGFAVDPVRLFTLSPAQPESLVG